MKHSFKEKIFFLLYLTILPSFLYAQARPGGEFKFSLAVHPVTLNPITASDNYTLQVMRWMVESLLTRDEETYAWVPRLAEKYEVSADGRMFTFDLRKGVKFHDGHEMTAEDVEFSFNVHRANLYGAKGNWSSELDDFDRVEILNQYRVRFHAKKPVFSSLATLAVLPIEPKNVYNVKEGQAALNLTVVGTGPYRLKEYRLNNRLVLEANPNWWGRGLAIFKGKFNFSEILVRFVEDEALALEMLEKGDLDYLKISLDSLLKKTKGKPWNEKVFAEEAKPHAVFTTQNSYFINLRLPIFRTVKTRRALQLLLNRPLLNEKFNGGKAVYATGPWHALSDYADHSLKPLLYDPIEAAKLLKEDGWSDSDGDNVLDKVIDGQQTDFRFTFMYPRREQERMLSIYQGDLKKAGVKMDLVQVDWNVFVKKLDELSFEGFVVGRGFPGVVDFNPRPEWHSSFTGPAEGNASGYKNTEVDRLLDRAETEFDRAKRIKLLAAVYKLAATDQSQIFLFSDAADYYGRTARVHQPKPYLKYELGMDNWWIE